MQNLPLNPNINETNLGLDSIIVRIDASFVEILQRHSGSKESGIPAGIVLVVDDGGRLIGTITDGDLRRGVLRRSSLDGTAAEVMTSDPIVFNQRMSFQDILRAIPNELRKRLRATEKFLGKIVLVNEQHRPVRVLDFHHLWEQRVATHRHISILGLGYVGLTLALTLADRGYSVSGIDVDASKIASLQRGELYVHEIGLPALLKEHLHRNFTVSTSMPDTGDVFILCVGTPVKPIDGRPEPSLDYLRSACELVGPKLSVGAMVILRSTVPIGTTETFVRPLLEKISGLRAGDDFHLVFAPERTVEGNALRELLELPQIIGGVNADSVEAASALFREINATIVRVASCEAAEMAKLINNCFRDLVFSFSNEMALLASAFNLDAVKVIKASNSGYPRDRVPLPSPGVGGPCLTKDPYILASVAKKVGLPSTLGENGRNVNERMIGYIAEKVLGRLALLGKRPDQARVLVCGLAFKGRPETGDLRNSPALDLCQALRGKVAALYGHDPVASDEDVRAEGLTPVRLPEGFKDMDVAIFMNNHHAFERLDIFQMVRTMAQPPVIFDGWSLLDGRELTNAVPCVYMSLSRVDSSVADSNL